MSKLSFSSDPRLEFSPVTRSLIGVNLLMFAAGLIGDAFGIAVLKWDSIFYSLALFPDAVGLEGQFWTPFTYMFLHANALHIFMNMMGLYLLGPDLERAFGAHGFLALYLVSGLTGGVGYVLLAQSRAGVAAPVVGASGAIMGLLGAIVAVYPRRVYVIVILMIPLRATVLAVLLVTSHLFFMFTPFGGRVAYDVHLFGGVAGYAIAACLVALHRRQWKDAFPPSERAYACVELETLAYELSRVDPGERDPEQWTRYQRLREALRYEDIPSVEELRATRA
jgi:membrane associated rhomboid family serine protease